MRVDRPRTRRCQRRALAGSAHRPSFCEQPCPTFNFPTAPSKSYPAGSSALDVARSISERLAQATIAAQIGDTVVRRLPAARRSLHSDPIPVKLLTDKDPAALGVLRHSCAHIMARAVMRLYAGGRPRLRPDHRQRVLLRLRPRHRRSARRTSRASKRRWRRSSPRPKPFERFNLPAPKRSSSCRDLQQELKVEHIETGLADHATLSFYRQGEFVDLCRGPHIPDAGKIKAFKLVSVAGSYWKGDANNKQLQRLYGTAFFDKKDLEAYLDQIEEAKRRDHRVLGKQHDLFTISNDVGQGLCLWLPKGATIRVAARRLHQAGTAPPRLHAGLLAAHRPGRDVRDQRALPVLPRVPVPADLRPPGRADSSTTGRPASARATLRREDRSQAAAPPPASAGAEFHDYPASGTADERQAVPPQVGEDPGALPAQADELPASRPDLQGRSRAATATCRCGWPSSAPSTATSNRAS